MSQVPVECLYCVGADKAAADRAVREVLPLLLAAVDAQREAGRPGQAYKVLGEWVVAVGDRAAGERQGLRLRADYYAVAYPITSEPAAYVLRLMAQHPDEVLWG